MQSDYVLSAAAPTHSASAIHVTSDENLIREIAVDNGLTVLCSLHQVDLALSWGDRIVGLRHGEVVLDTPAEGLSKAQVMEIYGRVATSTTELHAIENELADAAADVDADTHLTDGALRS